MLISYMMADLPLNIMTITQLFFRDCDNATECLTLHMLYFTVYIMYLKHNASQIVAFQSLFVNICSFLRGMDGW